MRLQEKSCVIPTCLAVVLLIPSLIAQSKRDLPEQETLQHEASAIVKLIPVRVLDANNRPVRGLLKQDFILHDNNELKIITEFEAYETGRISSPIAEPGTDTQPKSQLQTNRKYFILLDIQGSDEMGLVNAKKAALDFVETKVKPEDQVGVFSFAPMTGLVIQQYLTSDIKKIKTGIERAKEVPPSPGFSSGWELVKSESQALAKRGMSSRESSPFGGGTRVISVSGLAAYGRKSADFRVSMSELAKAIKYISGSKNLIYFSSREPGKAVARLFAEANTPVYAVNTQNWIREGVWTLSVKKKHIYEKHPLKNFAEASGGHYFADVKDIQTITNDIEILSGNYYVLGYYIDEKWDGRFHRIKIEVKKPGLRVLAQDGYYNPKPFAELTEIEKKLHLQDLAFADKPVTPALDLNLEALCCCLIKEANAVVLTKLEVDERLGIPPGNTEIFIFIFNKNQKIVAAERAEFDFASHDQKTLYSYLLKKLEPGDYECRVVARDMKMGKSLLGKYSFTIPEPASGAIEVLSPLLLFPGKKAEFLRFSYESKTGKKQASLIDFYPFMPQNASPLTGTLSADAKKVWVLLPIRFKDHELPFVELEIEAIGDAGKERIPLDWRIIDRKKAGPGIYFLFIEVYMTDLKPGDYWMEFMATDTNTGLEASVSSPLKIMALSKNIR